jgi:hypothetical protein
MCRRTVRNPDTQKHIFSDLQSAQIALYGATGLPIIVAVTAVAVKSEHMSSSNASCLSLVVRLPFCYCR